MRGRFVAQTYPGLYHGWVQHVTAFWKPRSKYPEEHQAIPNLPPRILQGAHEPVVGAGSTEGNEVSTGLGDTEGFDSPGVVPGLHRMRGTNTKVKRRSLCLKFLGAVRPHHVCKRSSVRLSDISQLIPFLPHELQTIGWICYDRVHGVVRQRNRLGIRFENHPASPTRVVA